MKFWNTSVESADIFIYGEITSERFWESDVSAVNFAKDLNSFAGNDVTIHINSPGGDVFSALAISNCMRNYSGKVFVSIEGLCASAATVLAMGADKISIANGSLYMIHLPSTGMQGYFDSKEIAKVSNALEKVTSSIADIYVNRTGKTFDEVLNLMENETWFSATEALESGFVDEVSGEISAHFDDSKKLLFVNKLSVDCRKFDFKQINSKFGGNKMEDTLLDKIKKLVSGKDMEDVRAVESERIRALNESRGENLAVNAILDVAIREGKTLSEVQPYVDALQNVKTYDKTAQAILDLISDNLNPENESVTGSIETTKIDERTRKVELIAKSIQKL